MRLPAPPPADAVRLLAALLTGGHVTSGGSFNASAASRLAAEDPSIFVKSGFTLRF